MAEPAKAPARSTAAPDDPRKRKMRAVLAACRRLHIDQDDRKSLQAELTGKASMATMSAADLGKLLDHLNRDWKRAMAHRPHVAKVKALWWTLYWIGEVADPATKALDSFVRRQTGVSALRFVDHKQAMPVIEALKDWAVRAGIIWPLQADVDAVKRTIGDYTTARAERFAVLKWLGDKLRGARVIHGNENAYIASCLKLPDAPMLWDDRQLDDAIRLLGRKWRDVK